MNKSKVQQIQKELHEAAKAIAERHGLELKFHRGSFTDSDFSEKIHFVETNEAGVKQTPELSILEKCFPGISEKTVDDRGRTIRFTGLNSRAPKFPVQFRDEKTGDAYKAPARMLAMKARELGYDPEAIQQFELMWA